MTGKKISAPTPEKKNFPVIFPFWTKMDNLENKKKQNLLYRNVRQNAENIHLYNAAILDL